MKIAMVILHADPMRGGAERYTVDLASALTKRGQEVSLLASSFAGEIPASVNQVLLDSRGPTRTSRYRAFRQSLRLHLDRMSYDIVHSMLPVDRCDIYHPHAGIAAAAIDKDSSVVTLFNPRRRLMAEVERTLLNGANPPRVLCLSEYVRQEIAAYYPNLPADRLPVLFNAIDLDRFQPPPQRPQREQIEALIIAQDFERKGLRETIGALAALRDRPLRLTVVGGDSPSSYQRLARRATIADRVTFAGQMKDPRPAYRSADFFVLPTRHDPCSLVVLEAIAMGLPVISTKQNGACEIMRDGIHGFVLPDPRDVAALADAMGKMLDFGLRARMSAACLELRPRLAYEHHLDQLMRIYQQDCMP